MKRIINQILLATCVIGAPISVFALPFKTDPQSFQNYMNTRKWRDGTKVKFQNLSDCGGEFGAGISYYKCEEGFATISNPMGVRICSLDWIMWQNDTAYQMRVLSCRYK